MERGNKLDVLDKEGYLLIHRAILVCINLFIILYYFIFILFYIYFHFYFIDVSLITTNLGRPLGCGEAFVANWS